MTICLVPIVQRLLRLTVLGQMALAGIALSLAPAVAETPTELREQAPVVQGDLAPDAVAVTDPDEIKRKLTELTIYARYYDGEDWIEYHLADGRTAYFQVSLQAAQPLPDLPRFE